MRLEETEIHRRLEVGVVQPNGKVGLLGLLSLEQLLENTAGIIGANEFDVVAGLVGKLAEHAFRKGSDVVG